MADNAFDLADPAVLATLRGAAQVAPNLTTLANPAAWGTRTPEAVKKLQDLRKEDGNEKSPYSIFSDEEYKQGGKAPDEAPPAKATAPSGPAFTQTIYNGDVPTVTTWRPGQEKGTSQTLGDQYLTPYEIGNKVKTGGIASLTPTELARFTQAYPATGQALTRDIPGMMQAQAQAERAKYEMSRRYATAQMFQQLAPKLGTEETFAAIDQAAQQGILPPTAADDIRRSMGQKPAAPGAAPGETTASPSETPETPSTRPGIPEYTKQLSTLRRFVGRGVTPENATAQDMGNTLEKMLADKNIGAGGVQALINTGMLKPALKELFGNQLASQYLERPTALQMLTRVPGTPYAQMAAPGLSIGDRLSGALFGYPGWQKALQSVYSMQRQSDAQ